MLKRLFYLTLFLFLLFASHPFILGAMLFKKDDKARVYVKRYVTEALSYMYQIGFNSHLYSSGNYIPSNNNIDILIGNHISMLDFFIYFILINRLDGRDYYILTKKQVLFFPFANFNLVGELNLNRKIEKDEKNIEKFINKIKSGVIVLFPEGTRKTKKKLIKSQKYSVDNNLHKFNNFLYPKMRGLHTIIKTLMNNNKLGNIVDVTCVVHKLRNKDFNSSRFFFKKWGNTYCHIETYKIPNDTRLLNYDYFKQWFLQIWIIKDNIIDNMDKFVYKRITYNVKSSTYLICLISLIFMFYMYANSMGIYPLSILFITCVLSFIKYKKL